MHVGGEAVAIVAVHRGLGGGRRRLSGATGEGQEGENKEKIDGVCEFFHAQGLATVVPEPFSPVTVVLQPALTSRYRDAGVPDSGKLNGATGKCGMGRSIRA